MPLIKKPTKKAFKQNVEAEMNAGKPQDQSLAIAYSIKKRNARKKMAQGGMADLKEDYSDSKTLGEAIGYPGAEKKKKMSEGGMVDRGQHDGDTEADFIDLDYSNREIPVSHTTLDEQNEIAAEPDSYDDILDFDDKRDPEKDDSLVEQIKKRLRSR